MECSNKFKKIKQWKKFYTMSPSDINFNGQSFYIQKPCIVGIMEDGKKIKKPQHLSYFRLPKQCDYPLDLNKGFENYKFRPENKFSSNLDIITSHIMTTQNYYDNTKYNKNSGNGVAIKAESKFEVVTHRGLLAILMQTPYYVYLRNWSMLAIQHKNKLYLMKGLEKGGPFPASSYHCKFKQYIFSDDPDRKPDSNAPIDEKEQLYCIYQTQLDNLNILYSAEVCGIISKERIEDMNNLNRCRFVHTNLMWEDVSDWLADHRIIDFWIKAYLVGVEDLYLGRKNRSGFVTQPIEHIDVKQLSENQKWSPKVCIKFMHTFINKIIEEMQGVDSPYTCYEFSFDHKNACFFSRVHEGKTSFSFLPEDFVEYLKK